VKYVYGLLLASALVITNHSACAQGQTSPGNGASGAASNGPFPISTGSNGEMREYNNLILQWKQAFQKDEPDKAIAPLEHAARMAIDGEPNVVLANIYSQAKRWDDVIRVLRPLIYPSPTNYESEGHYPTTRMLFVLAVLEKGNWSEAATVYEQSFTGVQITMYGQSSLEKLKWLIPGYQGMTHNLPPKHFSVNDPDYTGLQAQAHLILGSRNPEFVTLEDMPKYMLDHLKQSLKYDPESLDAHFISGVLLDKLGKFSEARIEFQQTANRAPETLQAEIKTALNDLDAHEKKKKEQDGWLAAHPPTKTENPTQP